MTAISVVGRPFAFLGRLVLWAAIGLVLVRGIVDLAASDETPTTEPRAVEATGGAPTFDVVRAQAFAVRFASEFASFDPANPDRRRQALESYLASNLEVDLLWRGEELVRPLAVMPVSTEAHGGGRATVTVAVQLAPSRWANLAVPLAGDGERFVVTDLPALVPAAAPAEGVEASARPLDDALAEELRPTIDAFFRAYGAQDQAALDRYALPGRTLAVLEGGFALDGVLSVDVAAPGDEPDRRRAWVTVRWATPTQGATFASAYELDLVRQDARWYVDGVGASRG